MQPYVKEWDFKTSYKTYLWTRPSLYQDMVLFKFKISTVSRDPFSSLDDDMDSEDYEKESSKCSYRKF